MGSNQRHALLGRPISIIKHALSALEMPEIDVFDTSPIVATRPIGPSSRCYANAIALISTRLAPNELLLRLQQIEQHFGRVRSGQRWRARTLDLDIILWSGGFWTGTDPILAIPHPQMRNRGFVLGPASTIAPDWRDPISGLSLKHLAKRLNRPKPLDRGLTPD